MQFVCMKLPTITLFMVFVSTGFAAGAISLPAPAEVSDDVLLPAIADVETGNNSARLGRRGERTHLQILPATWRRFSRLPHSVSATNHEETDRVARAYLAVIRQRLKARDLPETPFFIAAGWNAGPNWTRLSRRTISYADRVANLVEATRLQPAPAPSQPSVAVVRAHPTRPAQSSSPIPLIPLDEPVPQGNWVIALTTPRPLFQIDRTN